MKARSLSLVSVSLILLVGLVISNYLITSGFRVRQQTTAPIFYGEELTVNKAATVVKSKMAEVQIPSPQITMPLPVVPPQIVFSVLPTYPESALNQGLGGKTILSVFVGQAGEPEKVEVKTSSGVAELDQSAVAAVWQWKFSPAAQAGAVFASWFEIPVRFEVK